MASYTLFMTPDSCDLQVKSYCQECGIGSPGNHLCPHSTNKHFCRVRCLFSPPFSTLICAHFICRCVFFISQECKAAGIGGNGICIHDKRRGRCVDCGGSEMCRHGRRLARCFDCKGSEICEHSKIRCNCVDCGGSAICEHGKRKYDCSSCKRKKTLAS